MVSVLSAMEGGLVDRLHGKRTEEEVAKQEWLRTQWNGVRWYEPTLLLEQMEPLKQPEAVQLWKEDVSRLLAELSECFPAPEAGDRNLPRVGRGRLIQNLRRETVPTVLEWDFEDAEKIRSRQDCLKRLEVKIREAQGWIQSHPQELETAMVLGRAAFTLQRRLAAWRYCDGLMTLPPGEVPPVVEGDWNAVLGEVDALLARNPHAETWKTYLRFNALTQMFRLDASVRRDLALLTLIRLDANRLDPSQQAFLSQEPFLRLLGQLKNLAMARCASDYLLETVENYERKDEIRGGNMLIRECLRLSLEQDAARAPFRQGLEYTYRNANVRFAVSQEFLNRNVPQRGPEEREISEFMFNRPIYGKGITTTSTQVRMIPDAQNFRLGFLVQGNFQSNTYSGDGGVRVYNNSTADYSAFKEILFSDQGVRTAPAVAQVRNEVRLQDLQTPLDVIPILGFVANGVARSQAEAKQEEARQITEYKIRNEVQTTLDTEVDTRMNRLNTLWQTKLTRALSRMELDFQQVDARTDEHSATIRLRLANPQQPGGSTPRPSVPTESLLNFQIHESAVNNFIQQLKLDGKTFTPETIREYLKQHFPNWKPQENASNEDIPVDMQFTFSPYDAVSVRILERQFIFRLSFRELKIDRHTWKNFTIEVPFWVEYGGFQAVLKRDGVIRLIGRMPISQQIACRGVFSKIFPKELERNILTQEIMRDPRFSMLCINQCVLQDGWLGVSLNYSPTVSQR
ncbi:MAG: hypothetical protein Q4D98_07640 [Planctomycetia bacterium]|nr:hypothetical protein [Planctomycetia bacterium]